MKKGGRVLSKRVLGLALLIVVLISIASLLFNPKVLAATKLVFSNDAIVELSSEKGERFMIRNTEQGEESLIQMIEGEGWVFDKQDGSGYFFSNKEKQQMIITTQIWNSKFIVAEVMTQE